MLLPHSIFHISSSLPGTPFICTSKWMLYSHKISFIIVVIPVFHGTFRVLNSVYNYIIINMVIWLMASPILLLSKGHDSFAYHRNCTLVLHIHKALVNLNWTNILPVFLMLWMTWFFFLFSESLQSSSSVNRHLSRKSGKWSFLIVKKVWSQTTHAHTHTCIHTDSTRRKAYMGKDVFIVPQALIKFGIFSQKETCFLYHT